MVIFTAILKCAASLCAGAPPTYMSSVGNQIISELQHQQPSAGFNIISVAAATQSTQLSFVSDGGDVTLPAKVYRIVQHTIHEQL